jgi:hypothetical protein
LLDVVVEHHGTTNVSLRNIRYQERDMSLQTKGKPAHTKSIAPNYIRPKIGTFDEDADALGYAQTVRREYAEMEDGHHAAMRRFRQRAYSAFLQFRNHPAAFERLKKDAFWSSSRQRPKDRKMSKWSLYFVMQATTRNVRNRAGKFAVILDGFAQIKLPVREVAGRIEALGGAEAAYEAMLARKRGDAVNQTDEKNDDELEEARITGAEQSADGRDEIEGEHDGDNRPASPRSPIDPDESKRERSLQRSIDLRRCLVVELPDADLDRILNAVGPDDPPAHFRLDVIVRSPDKRGWAPVVGRRVTRIVLVSKATDRSGNARPAVTNVAATPKKRKRFFPSKSDRRSG